MRISYTVFGKCEAQGSAKAHGFFNPKTGKFQAKVTHDSPKLIPWRQQLARTAMDEMAKANSGDVTPIDRKIPVYVKLDFFVARPPSIPKKIIEPITRPDLDKYMRAIFDSLTGSVITDDSQITRSIVAKHYGSPERVEIVISTDTALFEEPAVRQTSSCSREEG